LLAASIFLVLQRNKFLGFLGHFLVCDQAPQHADVVLVLGGNFYGARVLKGADLAIRGYAPFALFSGPPYQGRPEGDVAIGFLAEHGYPTANFQSVNIYARSTIEEAEAVCPELSRRGLKRVLLVTASYHSRRAAIVFRLFCPGIQFISVPAPDPEYQADTWWMDARSREHFFSEWARILGTVFVEYPSYRIHGR
jgi:uncharacterized SAM-binding protein YcdF (DUF218 family)